MAKRDVINQIITEFPDRGYTAEQLDKEYTAPELEKLQVDLRAERGADTPPDGVTLPPEGAALDAAAAATPATTTDAGTNPGTEEGQGRVVPETSDQTKTEQDRVMAAMEDGTNKKYRLANPDTQYSEGDFTLTGDQERELPADPSSELLARIRSGFIVEA